ncbi:cytochrome c biogenesis CcdA family protein [Methylibium sp.]|uniref:cytochrome c biogenesis CcdA family protein n=1 Tax=Methylibium sp. TaxID=2067992 RepID=UPI003D0ACEFD
MMDFGLGSYGLGFLAGVLSTLSPCVLPLIPILLTTAVASHRLGAHALALGLMLSFTGIGLFIATLGASLGLDAATFRAVAAVLLIGFALVLLSTKLQARFARASSGLGALGDQWLDRLHIDGLGGQFVVGLVLGIIWSPCVGPTLGVATTLASQGSHLGQVALLMALFGLGAGMPLVLLGTLSRSTVLRVRGRMMAAGQSGKLLLGGVMLLLGAAILTGWDKQFEAWAVNASPAWLTELTTRF